MSLANHQNPDSRRRVCSVAACKSALMYALVLLTANVFSRGRGQHGWPFVYMTREWGRAGEFVFYTPWPLGDPPLLEFRASALVLNVVVGIVLTFLTARCVVYWLRARPTQLQFTIRGLFAVTSAAALLVATGMFFDLRLAIDLVPAAHWLIWIVHCCLVLTAAHWMVRRYAASPRKSRWFGIHWLTWVAMAAVVLPLLHYSFFQPTGFVVSGRENLPGMIVLRAFGWPLEYAAKYNGSVAEQMMQANAGFAVRYFNPFALLANILTSIAVVASTVFVVERWIRRTESGCRVTLRASLESALAVGLLFLVLMLGDSLKPAWYAYSSWLLGVLSTIYASEVLFFWGVGLTRRKLPRIVNDYST